MLYVISSLKRCGPVKQLLNIIRYLDRDKFEPVILTLSCEPEDTLYHEAEKENIELVMHQAGYLKTLFVNKSYRSKVNKEIKPDLIHVHGLRPDLLFQAGMRFRC